MTKRENSQINPNDPFGHTRTRFHVAPSSELRTREIGRQKKVKFVAGEKDSPRSCRLEEDSYMPSSQREKVTTCAVTDPKTSEYAFFKKLKKDASLRFRSRPLQKDAYLSSKNPESSDYSGERTSHVRVGSKGYKYNSSRTIEDISTVKTDSFLSPSGGAWNKSDLYSNSMLKNSQACGDTFKPLSHEGNQYVHGEIFSRKRQKLRQCVADALFPDIEKLGSKGHDIVSMLLRRLFPMSIEENKHRDPNPGKVMNATRYDLLDSQKSDVQFKEHYEIPERKLLELESSSHFSDQLLSPMFRRSDERIIPPSGFPTYHSHNFQPLYSITEPECKLNGTPSLSATAKSDVTLGSLFNEVPNATRYDLLDSRELDVQFTEHHQKPKRKLLELESSSYFSDHLLSPIFPGSDKRIIPHAEFPNHDSHNFQPFYSITEPECKLSGTPTFSATAKSDVTLGSLFNRVENATRYGLLDSQELEVQFREQHHQIPKRKLLELESSSYFSDRLLYPLFLRSVEKITPHADFPSYPHKFQPMFSITEAESKFGGTQSFIDKSDVTLGFLCNEQKHEIFTLNHFKQLGKLEKEPIPLLLEKDFDCTTNEISLPITYKYTEPDMAPALSILGHGEEQILNNTLGEYHFSSSSLLEDNKDKDTNFNHTALSLSHNKHNFTLAENCKSDTSCEDSIYLSPYQRWTRRKVSNDYNHHDTQAWLSSSLDFISGQRSLSLTSSHLNYQNSNSRTLQLPQRESMSSLYHINDNYKPEMDGGNHGEVLYHCREGLIEIYNSSFLRMSMQRDNGWPFPLDGNDCIDEKEQTHKMLL